MDVEHENSIINIWASSFSNWEAMAVELELVGVELILSNTTMVQVILSNRTVYSIMTLYSEIAAQPTQLSFWGIGLLLILGFRASLMVPLIWPTYLELEWNINRHIIRSGDLILNMLGPVEFHHIFCYV